MRLVQIGLGEHQTPTFLNILGEASSCPKAYLFLTGRCSLASLVKPETVDQIFSQAHCADEGCWTWLGQWRADKTRLCSASALASLYTFCRPQRGQPSVRKNNFCMISLNTTKGKKRLPLTEVIHLAPAVSE